MSSWKDPSQVDEYLGRVARLPQRAAGEAVMIEILPQAPTRVLDLGCGDGRLSALVLAARPSAEEIVAIDTSPPMLERARERFADDPRVIVQERDLSTPIDALGRFDLIVSGFALHHLADARKRTLFSEVARQLRPLGLFANLEVVASPTPALHAAFRAAIGREHDDPEDQLAAVDIQLAWMREAGLAEVDCMWKWRGFALLVGESAEQQSPGQKLPAC